MLDSLTYKPFGSRAILMEWPAKIDEAIVQDIIHFKALIAERNKDEIEDTIIAYHSLTIIYLNDIADFNAEKELLQRIYLENRAKSDELITLWKIPVCYDVQFGIDLEEISTAIRLSIEEIIQLHTQAIYTVYFIGFLPGFLYLGGLDQRMAINRRSNPRLNVAKGSVGIGGAQTGVYPMESAGGWNIIGRTPVSFFDVNQPNPCFAKAGDKIQFVSISLEEFRKLETAVSNGSYEVLKFLYHD